MQMIDLRILNTLYKVYNPYIPAFNPLEAVQKQKRRNAIIYRRIELLKKIYGIKFSVQSILTWFLKIDLYYILCNR